MLALAIHVISNQAQRYSSGHYVAQLEYQCPTTTHLLLLQRYSHHTRHTYPQVQRPSYNLHQLHLDWRKWHHAQQQPSTSLRGPSSLHRVRAHLRKQTGLGAIYLNVLQDLG